MKSAAAVLLMVICGIGLTVIEKEESAPEYIHSSCSSSDLDVGARLLDSGKYQPEIRFAGDYNDLLPSNAIGTKMFDYLGLHID